MVYGNINGLYGSEDLMTSVAEAEVLPDIKDKRDYTFQPIFTHISLRVLSTCHISINNDEYIYIHESIGGINIENFKFNSVKIKESGVQYHYIVAW